MIVNIIAKKRHNSFNTIFQYNFSIQFFNTIFQYDKTIFLIYFFIINYKLKNEYKNGNGK